MNKILFIDRDGTLIEEPEDYQVDCLSKVTLMSHVIPALLQLQQAGFQLVMVSNQDGLGTSSFPTEQFDLSHGFILQLFSSQGISFDQVRICPHFPNDYCQCRKPAVGLVLDYLRERKFDRQHSYVIGDRLTDLQLAENMGLRGLQLGSSLFPTWLHIVQTLLTQPRSSVVERNTGETQIYIQVNLDQTGDSNIETGIGFFDHMLEQLAKHSAMQLTIKVIGDLHVDEHHTVEDVALALGQALRQALGDKLGIARYGFVLPMDEAQATISMDLSGRPYAVFIGDLRRENVGGLPTELIPHFFKSLSETLKAAIHIEIRGENDHHMIEACFKSLGRTLRQAITRQGHELPTTKGVL
ncbi:MAG: bifunctional histidinol-phosphatase/imidazoleglycerol-phosphate dehydratase HisB [Legionellales bacterium]|nr:bifunctional histidinol-phosphatase/imidazoleglycerol-phosphate dehydratase HisB [Legionellales bacterium]